MNSVKLNIASLASSFVGTVTLICTNILRLSKGYDPTQADRDIVAIVDLSALALVVVGVIMQQVEIVRKRRAIFNVTHKYARDF